MRGKITLYSQTPPTSAYAAPVQAFARRDTSAWPMQMAFTDVAVRNTLRAGVLRETQASTTAARAALRTWNHPLKQVAHVSPLAFRVIVHLGECC